jgi:peroxidase
MNPLYLKAVTASLLLIVTSLSFADRENRRDPSVSPARQIEPALNRLCGQAVPPGEYRSVDGSSNDIDDPLDGAVLTALQRLTPSDYSDGVAEIAGQNRPSARVISNTVSDQEVDKTNAYGATDYLWQWGQFVDHDIDLTDGVDPAEPANILVPTNDLFFFLVKLSHSTALFMMKARA